jgi:hypothetical protein
MRMTQLDAKDVFEVVLVAEDHVLDLVIVIDEQEAAQEIVEGEADPEQVNQKTVRKTQSIQNLK